MIRTEEVKEMLIDILKTDIKMRERESKMIVEEFTKEIEKKNLSLEEALKVAFVIGYNFSSLVRNFLKSVKEKMKSEEVKNEEVFHETRQ